jgi:hypothetical protein
MAKEQTIFEKLQIPYVKKEGIFYPVLDVSGIPNTDENSESEEVGSRFVGKYGIMWLRYMRENQNDRYRHLIRFGMAEEKAREVNEEAYDMLDTMMKQYLHKHKPRDSNSTMEMWRIREQAKVVAEETVLCDIVYHYH